MRLVRKVAILLAAVTSTLAIATSMASAEWPMDRTMTIVVPFPAGSGADLQARIIAERLAKKWGNTVIVENRAGATGNLAQAYVAKAAPDGYTFIHTTPGPAANNMLTFKSLPFNPLTDFEFIAQTNESAMVLAAGPKMPAKDIKEFVAYVKANPGKVLAGHPGNGTYGHMTQLALGDLIGSPITSIPYRGTPQIITDLLGSQIDVSCDQAPAYMPMVQSGKLRVLAVIADQRSPLLPDVPTLKEVGINFSSTPWYGMEAPKGTPRPIIQRMNAALVEILTKDEEAAARFKAAGITPKTGTPEDFAKLVKDEIEKWAPIVKKYNVVVE